MGSVIVPFREGLYEYYMNVVMKLPSRLVFPVLKNIIFFNIVTVPISRLVIFITY